VEQASEGISNAGRTNNQNPQTAQPYQGSGSHDSFTLDGMSANMHKSVDSAGQHFSNNGGYNVLQESWERRMLLQQGTNSLMMALQESSSTTAIAGQQGQLDRSTAHGHDTSGMSRGQSTPGLPGIPSGVAIPGAPQRPSLSLPPQPDNSATQIPYFEHPSDLRIADIITCDYCGYFQNPSDVPCIPTSEIAGHSITYCLVCGSGSHIRCQCPYKIDLMHENGAFTLLACPAHQEQFRYGVGCNKCKSDGTYLQWI